jgi:hypothetical protein
MIKILNIIIYTPTKGQYKGFKRDISDNSTPDAPDAPDAPDND